MKFFNLKFLILLLFCFLPFFAILTLFANPKVNNYLLQVVIEKLNRQENLNIKADKLGFSLLSMDASLANVIVETDKLNLVFEKMNFSITPIYLISGLVNLNKIKISNGIINVVNERKTNSSSLDFENLENDLLKVKKIIKSIENQLLENKLALKNVVFENIEIKSDKFSLANLNGDIILNSSSLSVDVSMEKLFLAFFKKPVKKLELSFFQDYNSKIKIKEFKIKATDKCDASSEGIIPGKLSFDVKCNKKSLASLLTESYKLQIDKVVGELDLLAKGNIELLNYDDLKVYSDINIKKVKMYNFNLNNIKAQVDFKYPFVNGVKVSNLIWLPPNWRNNDSTSGEVKFDELTITKDKLIGSAKVINSDICSITAVFANSECFSGGKVNGELLIAGAFSPFKINIGFNLDSNTIWVSSENRIKNNNSIIIKTAPVNVQASLDILAKKIIFNNFNVFSNKDQLALDGDILYKPAKVSFNIKSKKIKFQNFIKEIFSSKVKSNVVLSSKFVYSKIKSKNNRTSVIVNIDGDNLEFNGEKLGEIKGPLKLSNKFLDISELNIFKMSGKVSLAGGLKMNNPATAKINLKLQEYPVDLKRFKLNSVNNILPVSGTLNISGPLKAKEISIESELKTKYLKLGNMFFRDVYLSSAYKDGQFNIEKLKISSNNTPVELIQDPNNLNLLGIKNSNIKYNVNSFFNFFSTGIIKPVGIFADIKVGELSKNLSKINLSGGLYFHSKNAGRYKFEKNNIFQKFVITQSKKEVFSYKQSFENNNPLELFVDNRFLNELLSNILVNYNFKGLGSISLVKSGRSKNIESGKLVFDDFNIALETNERFFSENKNYQLNWDNGIFIQSLSYSKTSDSDLIKFKESIVNGKMKLLIYFNSKILSSFSKDLLFFGDKVSLNTLVNLKNKNMYDNFVLSFKDFRIRSNFISEEVVFFNSIITSNSKNVAAQNFSLRGELSQLLTGSFKWSFKNNSKNLKLNLNKIKIKVGDLFAGMLSGGINFNGPEFSKINAKIDVEDSITSLVNIKNSPTSEKKGYNPSLKLSLNLVDNNKIVDNLFQFFLDGDLLVENSLENIEGSGDLQIVDNSFLKVREKIFLIDHGNIKFTQKIDDPIINIRADHFFEYDQDYLVNLAVSGPVSKLDFNLSSDPALTQSQLSYLLAFSTLPEDDSVGVGSRAQAEAFQLLFGDIIAKKLDEKTGFKVNVSSKKDLEGKDLVPKVTVVKKLSENIVASFGRSLESDKIEQDVKIDYNIHKNIGVSGVWENSENKDPSFGLDLRFKFDVD